LRTVSERLGAGVIVRGKIRHAKEIMELPNGSPKQVEREPIKYIFTNPTLGITMGFAGKYVEWVNMADKSQVMGRYKADSNVLAASVHPNLPILLLATENKDLIYLNMENLQAPSVMQKISIEVFARQINFIPTGQILVSYLDETGQLKHKKISGPGPQYGFAPILGMPLWESVDPVWAWVGLGVVAALYWALSKYGNTLRIHLAMLYFRWNYRGFTISERRILERIRKDKLWRGEELLPIRQYNLNDRTISRQDLEMFQRTVVQETRDPLDMALYSMLREKTSPDRFDLDPNSPWPSNGHRTHLRIRMADPEILTVDTEDILKDLGRNDVAVVFANEKAQFSRPDSRIVRLSYSNQDLLAEKVHHALNLRLVNIKQIDMAQIRMSKAVMKKKGTVRFLHDMVNLIGEKRLDVFVLLPISEKINAMVPVDLIDVERLVDFENLTRKIIQTQA
jgi:hypothetical protein